MKKKIFKIGLIVIISGLIIGGGIGLYMFNMPHRDVQSADTDYSISSSQLIQEYLNNYSAANEKYLSDDGNSKILEITGTVKKVSEDFNGQLVVLLKNENDKAGVSCSFSLESTQKTKAPEIGTVITIKGVIRSGASFDEDLEMYENVIIDKATLIG